MQFTIDSHDLAEICRENDISQLRVFGSYASGDATVDSDVDLLAAFSRRKSLVDVIQIEEQTSQRLGKKVDLVTEAA